MSNENDKSGTPTIKWKDRQAQRASDINRYNYLTREQSHFPTNDMIVRSLCKYRASDVVNDDSSSSASVVHGGQAVVPLLSSSVPDLELHRGIIHGHRLWEERSPNRRFL